jgi:hypothetical protein
VENFHSEIWLRNRQIFARIFSPQAINRLSHRNFFLLALMVLYSDHSRAYDRVTSFASSVQHQRQPIKNFLPSAALLWPAIGKMKSVKDATQEDDPLR